MSKMNLQKLRQVCYVNERNDPSMKIILPPNDTLNRVEFTDKQGDNHSAQARDIRGHFATAAYSSTGIFVTYSTEEDLSRFDRRERRDFNYGFGEEFLPRLKQILVDNGFHSDFLPREVDILFNDHPLVTFYSTTVAIHEQIKHACYYDGRSMRAAVEYQAELNKK